MHCCDQRVIAGIDQIDAVDFVVRCIVARQRVIDRIDQIDAVLVV